MASSSNNGSESVVSRATAEKSPAYSNGSSLNPDWDGFQIPQQLYHRAKSVPLIPNRLRVFAGTSNSVRISCTCDCTEQCYSAMKSSPMCNSLHPSVLYLLRRKLPQKDAVICSLGWVASRENVDFTLDQAWTANSKT